MSKRTSFYFGTFGQNQFGGRLKNYIVELGEMTAEEARTEMFETFGQRWSMVYPHEEVEERYYPDGAVTLEEAVAIAIEPIQKLVDDYEVGWVNVEYQTRKPPAIRARVFGSERMVVYLHKDYDKDRGVWRHASLYWPAGFSTTSPTAHFIDVLTEAKDLAEALDDHLELFLLAWRTQSTTEESNV